MFGYIIINKGDMKFNEFDIYQSFYCGLCRTLKSKYGRTGQMTLSYDMTFLVMLLTGLYEPETLEGETNCIMHPFEKHQTRINQFSEYAADMNILLSYFKCLDDWEDDKKCTKLLFSERLHSAYRKIRKTYPDKVYKIEKYMAELSSLEKRNEDNIDKMAGLFGEIMVEILDYKQDEWKENIRNIGFYLGKFIYLMDAYEDIEKDIKSNSYNPLKKKYENPDFEEECGMILTMMMAECSKEFEKLPVIEYVEILRNILYSGVWYRYDAVKEKREKEQKHE